MNKLALEIKEASPEKREVILNFVSHIDLKKEYIALVEAYNALDKARPSSTIPASGQPAVSKTPLKQTKKKASKKSDKIEDEK